MRDTEVVPFRAAPNLILRHGAATARDPLGRWRCARTLRTGTAMSPLCGYCKPLMRTGLHEPRSSRADEREWQRLREVLCRRCERILPSAPVQPRTRMTFAALTRFGLTDGGDPILDVATEPAAYVGSGAAR